MISGLRNDWELWGDFEARNRKDYTQALAFAMRVSPSCNLMEAENNGMASFGAAVEAVLDSTARAFDATREDLDYCIAGKKIQWRENTYRVIEAQCFGTVRQIDYKRTN